MAEDGEGMAFSLAADYSDGEFGSDGEFYGRRRVKRKMTKDEQLYGVFANDGKKSRQPVATDRPQRGMFVHGGVEGGSANDGSKKKPAADASERENVAEEENKEEKRSYGFRRQDSSDEDEEDEKSQLPQKFGAERRRPQASKDVEQKDQPSSATSGGGYGIGAKFLAKMGWEGGGLGKEGKGITKIVEVNVRQGRVGLGLGSEKDQNLKTEESEKSDAKKGDAARATGPSTKKWKKKTAVSGGKPSQREVPRDVEKMEVEKPTSVVIDMRGPSAKVFESAEKALRDQSAIRESFLSELEQFIKLTADLAVSEKERLLRRVDNAKATRRSLQEISRRRDELRSKLDEKKRNCEGLLSKLDELERVKGPLQVSEIARTMWRDYRKEYSSCKVSEGVAKAVIRTSQTEKKQEDVVAAVRGVKDILSDQEFVRIISTLFFAPMQRELLGPKFNSSAPEPVIQKIELWRPALSDEMAEIFFDRSLVPALFKAAEKWTDKSGVLPHQLLFPWLPVLGKKNVANLFTRLSHAFGRSLSRWSWDDIRNATEPWSDILKDEKLTSFMSRYVAPSLEERIGKELVIDPSGKNQIQVLDKVGEYAQLAGREAAGEVLYASFFPKWLRVLRSWLSDARVDVDEISSWYQSWTKILLDLLGGTSPHVEAGRKIALEMMRNHRNGDDVSRYGVKEQLAARQRALVATYVESSKPQKKETRRKPTSGMLSVRELVEQYAAKIGVAFTSAGGQYDRDGHALYFFGGIQVYFDSLKELIYAREGAGQEFLPVSLSELVELNEKT